MTTYYVATLAQYVLVEAEDEDGARALGREVLTQMYDDYREQEKRGIPVQIRTVRMPSDGELELWRWHQEMLASERTATS
jgi:hypothetical protein